MNAKIIALLLIGVLVITGGLLAQRLAGSDSWMQANSSASFFSAWQSVGEWFEEQEPASAQKKPWEKARVIEPTAFPTQQPSASPSIRKVSPSPSPVPSFSPALVPEKASPLPITEQFQPSIPTCNRATVTHLDGSTSSLCYSASDYQQLRSLQAQLSSAETFYRFHLDGVADYQQRYEETGSDIYLDAKASQRRQADEEQAKIGELHLQIYVIESRGW